MPRENKTRFVLLGLLSLGPQSGYGIKKYIEMAIGHFWGESFGQIYPMLTRLCDEGLARRTAKPNGSRSRFIYHITRAGENELRRWLQEPPEPEIVRIELLLKLFFGRKAGPDGLESFVAAFGERAVAEHELLKEYEKMLVAEQVSNPDARYWLTTLRLGLHVTRARAIWAEETLNELREISVDASTASRGAVRV